MRPPAKQAVYYHSALIHDVAPLTVWRDAPKPPAAALPPVVNEQTPAQANPSVSPPPTASAPLNPAPGWRERLRPHHALYAMAALVFIAGIAVSLNGWATNKQVAAQVKKAVTGSTANNSEPPPSAVKPSAAAIGSYSVAPDLPRYIDIPALSVHARVFQTGVTKTGALGTPNDIYDADWYTGSAKPGQPGAMLVDGHISSWTAKGVFYGLTKLAAGDTLKITRGDGTVFNYTVVKTKLYDANSVDMASLLVSADTAKPGLNLISCAGDVIPGTNEFNQRIAVFAVEN